ncbi:MAG: DNA repair protein RadC [Treponema sp.]|nr:DNA repair protein RadC [Treponema sp.]
MNEIEIFGGKKAKPNVREMAIKNGIEFPSDEELLMLILNGGTKKMPLEKLAEKALCVINEYGTDELVEHLTRISGMGDAKALALAAAVELGRRRNSCSRCRIERPSDIVPYVKHFSLEKKEHFVVATVNGARELLNIRVVSIGTVSRTLVHPREVFAEAITEHAAGIICFHNHPCGPCLPSNADRTTTTALEEAAVILGITFMDHIIVTHEDYFSFLEHGLLKSSHYKDDIFTVSDQENIC